MLYTYNMSGKTDADDVTFDAAFDNVFKALSNSTRRRILDLLKDHPRTTGEVCASFPEPARGRVGAQAEDVLQQHGDRGQAGPPDEVGLRRRARCG